MQDERIAGANRRHRSFSWAAIAVASILISPGAGALPPSPTTCYAVVTIAIVFVGWDNPANHDEGCGYMMVINHANGDTSTYCHLLANSETRLKDDWVRAGSVIANANKTGGSTGDHLHLVYKIGGTDRVEYWDVVGNTPSASELNGDC